MRIRIQSWSASSSIPNDICSSLTRGGLTLLLVCAAPATPTFLGVSLDGARGRCSRRRLLRLLALLEEERRGPVELGVILLPDPVQHGGQEAPQEVIVRGLRSNSDFIRIFRRKTMVYDHLLVFEPARVKEELLELRRVRRAQVSQAHRLLDVAHDLVPDLKICLH